MSLKDNPDQQVYLDGRFMSLRDAVSLAKEQGETHVEVNHQPPTTYARLFNVTSGKLKVRGVQDCRKFVSVDTPLEDPVNWIRIDEMVKMQGVVCPA